MFDPEAVTFFVEEGDGNGAAEMLHNSLADSEVQARALS